jgi:flagellar hook-associated protein 2
MSNTTIFSGSSRYAADFQQVIERAVAIASLPITQLGNQRVALVQKQDAYNAIGEKITAVDNAVRGLLSALGGSSYTSASSNASVATASASAGTLLGAYSITVEDPGAVTRAISSSDLASQLSPASEFTLSVDGDAVQIHLQAPTLDALAAAINEAHHGVLASVVNYGSASAPDYRLSLQSTAVADVDIQLDAGEGNLITPLVTGRNATYRIDGYPAPPDAPISSNTRNVTIAPGLVVNLLQAGTTEIQVCRTSSPVMTSLGTLVTAYNNAVGELGKHRGQAGGALSGDSQVLALASALRSIVNYSGGSGTVKSLADLGLRFDNQGMLSLDASVAAGLDVADIEKFMGDGTSSGFLANATSTLNSINSSGSGLLRTTLDGLTSQISRQDQVIEDNQERVDLLRESLNAKMAAADALIASMEQQVTYFTGLFEAMQENARQMR